MLLLSIILIVLIKCEAFFFNGGLYSMIYDYDV